MTIVRGIIVKGSSFTLLRRIRLNTGEYPTPEDIESVTVNIRDTTGEAEDVDLDFEPADVISETLVTDDPRWNEDSTGQNLVITVSGEHVPRAVVYHATVTVSPVDGFPVKYLWEVQAVD